MPRLRCLCLALVIVSLFSLIIPAYSASKNYTGTIVRDRIIFRAGPSTESECLMRFKKGDKVAVSSISGDFYQVTFNRIKGYVMRKFVNLSDPDRKALEKTVKFQKTVKLTKTPAPKKTATPKATPKPNKATPKPTKDPMKGITKVSQIKVPATSKKGNSGNNVLALQQALRIKKFYKGDINSKFDNQTLQAVLAFQKANKLKETGEADFDTIQKLFGQKAANFKYKTEKLDWFNGGSKVIPRGATFTVKDVLTGKTFKCKHLYGSNHMDTEPLNSTATETIKKLYGGKWSWARRAVLVMYKGHVYAGSMNGMPHGNCKIKTNQFDGHFCIHFSGSMTHESKKVDSAHQNAVKRALRATW